MKYYKLVNDIPMFKKGDLFFIHPEEGCLLQKDTLRLAYHKKTLEKNPEILKEWFEVAPEEYKRWRAGNNGKYWYLDGYGSVDYCYEDIGNEEDNSYDIGNYFRTEEEAKVYKEYLLARQVLLDDAEGGKWKRESSPWIECSNWYACYNGSLQEWVLDRSLSYCQGSIYFKNKEALRESLKIHKEQWEIVRKYEMGEM